MRTSWTSHPYEVHTKTIARKLEAGVLVYAVPLRFSISGTKGTQTCSSMKMFLWIKGQRKKNPDI